ncbi:DUF1015 family protein [Kibdelosporangium phytohabitans]|uniref:DUF1015 domain-containing protein n=1 Tax=Kibdelosporangium phytohabitans TaxID=860235 RepID=A0A0N9HV53_9PSEU|nr:DUF1015 family protein [Kibdelosporangium phytohabitans]ALG09086.1 hypothetical protein AOZ06_21125 [Kibdelosporangium phytohabitans]MBE1469720.1 hypothetical protein [Kibdelosporangium phytohabitans]
MDTWVSPVRRGWVVRDAIPGPGVDEFAEPDQVIAALAQPGAADGTLLAVQHPHRTPTARASGLDVLSALPITHAALDQLRASHYEQVTDVVGLSWGDGPEGSALGLLCVVDPAAVSADGLAYVRHTEEVYPDVVAERATMLSGLRCATSAAMLVPAGGGARFTRLMCDAVARLGEPAVSLTDSAGRRSRMWLAGKGDLQDDLLAAASAQSLLVADGNHRVAAAARAGRGSLLALITAGPDLRIGPIHRVLTGTGLSTGELAARWRQAGLDVQPSADHTAPAVPGTVVVLGAAGALRVTLPRNGLEIDHRLVEQLMVERALGLDPAGPHLRPLPPGRPARPDADAVLLTAPVPLADVLAVHATGRQMPRKATYFTPKPRSGLLLAEIPSTP